jgi:hypothetical protein
MHQQELDRNIVGAFLDHGCMFFFVFGKMPSSIRKKMSMTAL